MSEAISVVDHRPATAALSGAVHHHRDRAATAARPVTERTEGTDPERPRDGDTASGSATATARGHDVVELSDEDEREVERLQEADRSVRAHEMAHKAAGGQYAGAISYSFTRGPDGQRYATSGEVPIDITPVSGDPDATIRKMEQVRRAALAPADPSAADRRVAAKAQRLAQEARTEKTASDDGAETDPTASGAGETNRDAATGSDPAPAPGSGPADAAPAAREPIDLLA